MADYTITVSNTLNVFGNKKTSRWGSMVWGTGKWGYGDFDLITTVYKVVGNTVTLAGATIALSTTKVVISTMVVTGNQASQYLYDSNGYYHIFNNDENAENRSLTSYTSLNTGSATYSTVADPSTTWTAR